MTRLGRKPWPIHAAALLAVALLSFASVQSIVMQAAGDGSASMGISMGPDCPMGGANTAPHNPADKSTGAPCPFCAAAAQAPLASAAVVLRAPVAVVWSPRPVRATLGPRGPPHFRARARAPPLPSQTV